MRAVRGKDLGDLGGLPATFTLWHVLQRGTVPVLRGTLRRLFLRNSRFPLFVGRGVRILSPSLLYANRGVFLGDYSYVNCYSTQGIRLGRNVTVREFAWIQLTSRLDHPGVSLEVGDDTYIGPRATLGAAAPVKIGSRCQLGANVSLIAESHLYGGSDPIFNQGVSRKGIVIGDDCWIGNNAIILDGVSIGSGSVIGAGSVVTRSVPGGVVAAGVPARVIRTR